MISAVNNFSNYSYQTTKTKAQNKNQSLTKETQYSNSNLSFASKKLGIFDSIKNALTNKNLTPATKIPTPTETTPEVPITFVNRTSLDKVKIEKGVCTYPNGKPFSGEVKGTLKDGDNISLVYDNGIIKSSERKGSKNFSKEYFTENGKIYRVNNNDIYDLHFDETRFTYGNTDKLSSVEFSDGTLKTFYENGKPLNEIYSNGHIKRYDRETGKLTMEEFPDGTEKFYDEDGNLSHKILSNGTEKFYDEDGEITKSIKITQGETIQERQTYTYRKDGRLSAVEFPDGITRTYYDNGNLLNEISKDGVITRYDRETGKLTMEEFPDGVQKFYDKDGNLTALYTDSSERHFDSDGKITYEVTATGTVNHYDTDGNLSFKVLPNGIEVHYDSDGNVIYKKLLDGRIIDNK